MANLLAEQLLKAGLVDKDRAKALEREKHQKKKKKAPKKAARKKQATHKPALTPEQKEKIQRDKELNALQRQKAEARASQAAIRQWVTATRVDRSEGDTDFQYVYANKIRKMLVTAEMRVQLLKGSLCIVNLDGQFEVVPAGTARKVAQKRPNLVVDPSKKEDPEQIDEAYAEYAVPDDLVW